MPTQPLKPLALPVGTILLQNNKKTEPLQLVPELVVKDKGADMDMTKSPQPSMLSQVSTQTGKFGVIVASNSSENDDFTSACEAAISSTSCYTYSSPIQG